VDFGLVKNLSAAAGSDATGENTLLGTPHYMAPEALRSPDRVDARSDIYALGATAYFLLTGAPVFEGSVPDVFAGHLKSDPVAPSRRLGRSVPPSLEALVLAALAKKPEARPESAEAFGEALAACRDVPPWSEAEARSWWATRGAAIRMARAREASAGSSSTAPTVLATRRAAASPGTRA
jgi:serine/threonine-protein kinase